VVWKKRGEEKLICKRKLAMRKKKNRRFARGGYYCLQPTALWLGALWRLSLRFAVVWYGERIMIGEMVHMSLEIEGKFSCPIHYWNHHVRWVWGAKRGHGCAFYGWQCGKKFHLDGRIKIASRCPLSCSLVTTREKNSPNSR